MSLSNVSSIDFWLPIQSDIDFRIALASRRRRSRWPPPGRARPRGEEQRWRGRRLRPRRRFVPMRLHAGLPFAFRQSDERLLVRGLRAGLPFRGLLGAGHRRHLDGDLGDLAGEPVRRRNPVVLDDRRLAVFADVGPFVGREDHRLRPLDPPFGHLLAVDEDRPHAPLAEAAAVVGELEADRRLPGRHGLRRGDGEALQAEEVVGVGRLAVLQVEAPAAEPAGLGRGSRRWPPSRGSSTSAVIVWERFFVLMKTFSDMPVIPS